MVGAYVKIKMSLFLIYKKNIYACKDAIQCRPWALGNPSPPPYRILLVRFQNYLYMIVSGQPFFLNFEKTPFWGEKTHRNVAW